ncbi:hypothetical protein THRCLA_21245 [Thraustotheca clavata]|uniref:Uncharacterized protein n=1 Tax=Thraustotheca clavata TaxID=74557 RepID=A0A1V9ZYJ1_9STRA|nr:hypothetical protein THRCLA_21245 [Thraustotheca clavata]
MAMISQYQVGLPHCLIPIINALKNERNKDAKLCITQWIGEYGVHGIDRLLPHLTASMGNVLGKYLIKLGFDEYVEYMYQNCVFEPTADVVCEAARMGNLHIVSYLHLLQSVVMNYGLMEAAACSGNLNLIRYLLLQFPKKAFSTSTLVLAVRHGHLHVVRFLTYYKEEIEITDDVLDAAASIGRIDIVRYIAERLDGFCSEDGFNQAVSKGFTKIVKYLFRRQPLLASKTSLQLAASNGRLNIVQFLLSKKIVRVCSSSVMAAAAFGGHLSTLRHLHDNVREAWSSIVVDSAAEGGNVEIVSFLLNNSRRCTSRAVDNAACNGHLEIVEMLLNLCKPFTENAIVDAARNGHLDIVKLLIKHQSPVTHKAMIAAAQSGSIELAKLLFSNYQRQNEETNSNALLYQMVEDATVFGHYSLVLYFSQLCTPDWKNLFFIAIQHGHEDITRYIHHNFKIPILREHFDTVVVQKHKGILSYLLPFVPEDWIVSSIISCSLRRDRDMMQVLTTNQPFLHRAICRNYLGYMRCYTIEHLRFQHIFLTAPMPPIVLTKSWFLLP